MPSGERSSGIGVIGASAIGIGGMVGGGIFAVLGTAVLLAGGGTPLAFAIAGVVALLTAYSYARLSVAFPESGGTIIFIDRAFSVNFFTGSLSAMLWLSYLVTIALYAAAFGAYGVTFFSSDPEWLTHVLLTIAIIVPAILNILSSTIVSKSESAIVMMKLGLLALVVIAGATQIDAARFAPSTWEAPSSIVVAGMVIFVAYEGFELIANAAEDVRDPNRTLPRAIYGSVIFVIALYVLVSIVTVGSVTPDKIVESKDFALAAAARPSLGQAGFVLVALSALLATFSAINATIYGNARLGFALAKDGEIPKIFEKRAWRHPLYGVALTALFSLLLANLVDLEAIAILGSAGFLVIFTAVNASAFKLAKSTNASRVVSGVATIASAAALIALLQHAYVTTPKALVVFTAMVIGALVFEIIYPRLTGRDFRSIRRHTRLHRHHSTITN